MRFVADASTVVAYLLGEGSAAERVALLGDAHAPSFVDVEVTQTLRGLLRGAKLDVRTAGTGRLELAELQLARHPDAALLPRAWQLRDVCTTYDALYVALAEALDATLVTRDERLARGTADFVAVSTPEA